MPKELDARGLQCPEPVIRCRKLIDAEHPNSLKVFVDNLAAVENVSRFLDRNGYQTLEAQIGEKEWRIEATKDPKSKPVEEKAKNDSYKTLVFLPAATLGSGDDELGARLMENFIATLPELGSDLWRIIMVNGGVKLAATAGTNLENLKKLESSGVSILVCGTCLMHYGLMDNKEVGETTNMLDIVTSLGLAQKIIRP